jgi:tRNA G18 (ribose-2'-O)-methylase SpoU
MFDVQHIASFDLPELAPYRTMKFQSEHRKQGIFVAESDKVVRRLLESDLGVLSMILPEPLLPAFEKLLNQRKEKIHIYCAPKTVLEQLTGFAMYQGVMAVGKVPEQPSLDAILKNSPAPRLLVAADGICNSQNVGVLVRNCAAFSADAILVAENSCSPFLRRAVGSSVGTIFRLPAVELTSLTDTIIALKTHGIRCIAAHPHTNKRIFSHTDFTRDCCLVFGSEGEGIRPEVLDLCDETVAIPMPSHVDSLNVGSASAVFLYEAAKHRRAQLPTE